MSARDDGWKARVEAEQETIQVIAEHLQREHQEKTISELWPEARLILQ